MTSDFLYNPENKLAAAAKPQNRAVSGELLLPANIVSDRGSNYRSCSVSFAAHTSDAQDFGRMLTVALFGRTTKTSQT